MGILCHAQDQILLSGDQMISGKVTEVSQDSVYVIPKESPQSGALAIAKAGIYRIRYANGAVDSFTRATKQKSIEENWTSLLASLNHDAMYILEPDGKLQMLEKAACQIDYQRAPMMAARNFWDIGGEKSNVVGKLQPKISFLIYRQDTTDMSVMRLVQFREIIPHAEVTGKRRFMFYVRTKLKSKKLSGLEIGNYTFLEGVEPSDVIHYSIKALGNGWWRIEPFSTMWAGEFGFSRGAYFYCFSLKN